MQQKGTDFHKVMLIAKISTDPGHYADSVQKQMGIWNTDETEKAKEYKLEEITT